MFGEHSGSKVVAIAMIESGSATIALLKTGACPELLTHTRIELPLEDREKAALRSVLVKALASAGETVLGEYAKSQQRISVSSCYCIVSAPWTRSFTGPAHTKFDRPMPVTEAMVSALAKQALADQKDIDHATLFEAAVSRILLNGYPTTDPEGKHAETLDIFTLMSDCDPQLKDAASEVLAKLFPGSPIMWRSSARAMLAYAKQLDPVETCLIVQQGGEATDLISVHKGIIDQRVLVEQGFRQILNMLAKGKPATETLALMEMIEKDECDDAACEDLRKSIAKAEPELVPLFGKALTKLSARRKLPDKIILIAPRDLLAWLSHFFERIDFKQFTATTKPFSVKLFTPNAVSGLPSHNGPTPSDISLASSCELINTELSS